MSSGLIEGKIAKIIDSYRVVINRGFAHGVKDGMRFVIFNEGDTIFDPDTGKPIGKFENVKGKIEVVNTQEKFSTAQSDEFSKPPNVADFDLFTSRRIPLSIEEKDKVSIPTYTDLKIRIGDKVRQIP